MAVSMVLLSIEPVPCLVAGSPGGGLVAAGGDDQGIRGRCGLVAAGGGLVAAYVGPIGCELSSRPSARPALCDQGDTCSALHVTQYMTYVSGIHVNIYTYRRNAVTRAYALFAHVRACALDIGHA